VHEELQKIIQLSLQEDIGSGDITAELISPNEKATAHIITRESAIICGIDWVNEVYVQIDSSVIIDWKVKEGAEIKTNQIVAELKGLARSLVTGERCALNWLQTLSGTATTVKKYCSALKNTHTQLLDTRKTIPGLRMAQKYAVKIVGGKNHRMGLFDAYLIKENHIAACGGIQNAVAQARTLHPKKIIEVEVENLEELTEALECGVDIIMLDNFTMNDIKKAVLINQKQAKLEVSGNINLDNLKTLADTGVDYISIGALTKHLHAIDFSMRFLNSGHDKKSKKTVIPKGTFKRNSVISWTL
jgi:nicotinate-nucleotide pyrophosphorylase (carboxylating)